ncbi:hypothetical protein A2955_04675 [Candidatus Woesebacteria bacterium RIFCSPLOWO2_01_FULL_37_19]|uniref:ABC transporter domain-containing protein n=1 Tax=Candidatus Woesebacteria bacterium RIFCSPLOWO2_01_FULL_37_19 TaxID=1802514 RepID=A0A1F8BBP4_9BACT|nr:MAG: hypothetical protein A2955_04675 [Candidatus Woesebacteria bacterium RIFCSPLOWO2_01_FULL_37_19]
MVKKLWRLLAPFHQTFLWFIVLLIVYEGLQIADSYVISLVIKLFGEKAEIYIWTILVAGLVVYDEVFNRLDNALDWHIIIRQLYPIYKYLKTSALSKFLELDIKWHNEHNSGALVGKVNNGVDKVQQIVEGLSWEFVPTLVQTILSIIPLLILSPLVSLIAVVSLALFLWLTVKSNRKRMPSRKLRHDIYEEEWHSSIEYVQSIETVKTFVQEERFLNEYNNKHERIVDLGQKELKIGLYYNRWRIRVLSIARRLILVIWIWQLQAGLLSVADLVFVNVLTERLFHSFWRFARLLDRAAEASEGAERLVNLLKENPEIVSRGIYESSYSPIGIELKNVSFTYNGKYDLDTGTIHNLNLKIEPGSIVALVGPSGAGKTTIRRLITRLMEIHSGEIFVGEINIKEWSLKSLRGLFSYVPQGDDVAIHSTSVRKNISLPKPDATLEEVINASKLAGIDDFISNELADGYDTLLGERGKKLSGGQKQRVALARAILADRSILILDEATSSVDAITEREIQEKMRKILTGKTAIIIAHRLSTIWDIADKIVVLESGTKVEEGTHFELIQKGGLYAKMVKLQT